MGRFLDRKPSPEERETYVVQLAEHFRRINLLGTEEGTLEEQVAWMEARREARIDMDIATAEYKKRFGYFRERSAWREAFIRHLMTMED